MLGVLKILSWKWGRGRGVEIFRNGGMTQNGGEVFLKWGVGLNPSTNCEIFRPDFSCLTVYFLTGWFVELRGPVVYSESCQISKMEPFAEIVNGFQLLTISAKTLNLRSVTEFWIHFWGHLNDSNGRSQNSFLNLEYLFWYLRSIF